MKKTKHQPWLWLPCLFLALLLLITPSTAYADDGDGDGYYLTFSSEAAFTLGFYGGSYAQFWEGKVEYSTDTSTWTTWNSMDKIVAKETNGTYYIYLRGSGNSYIIGNSGYMKDSHFVIDSENNNVSCSGNIMTLLDYTKVAKDEEIIMSDFCFTSLFCDCVALTSAPDLPSTKLSFYCYESMFYGCSNLTQIPDLPATELAESCYSYMFGDCTSLTTLPELNVSTLEAGCCGGMFYGCKSIEISSVATAEYCVEWSISCTNSYNDDIHPWNNDMFAKTGGPFTDNPEINTTYYIRDCSKTSCTLSFETNGGDSLTSITANYNQYIDLSEYIPTRNGYTFVGWYEDADLDTEVTIYQIKSDSTVYAGWAEEMPDRILTFNLRGHGETTSISVAYNETVNLSQYVPTNECYEFTGWYTDLDTSGTPITSITMVSHTTIYAGWKMTSATLTFETNGGTKINDYTVTSLAWLTLSDFNTTKDGYTFIGWYSDADLTESITKVILDENVTIYAGWALSLCTLDFNTNGGSSLPSETLDYETVVDLSGYIPTRTGYTFAGWYLDSTLIDKVTSITITEDTTVYAKWKINSYTLTFKSNGGSSLSSLTKNYNTTIDLSSYTPTRTGYTFTGWYLDSALTKKITSVTLTKNTTIYAGWKINSYTLTFKSNGGSSVSSLTKNYNTAIKLSSYNPTRTGYTFTGWYLDSALTKKITSVTLTQNTTIYAGWEKNETPVQQFVRRLYELVLGRTPDTTGFNNWVNALNAQTTTGAEVAYGFIFSSEYQNKNTSNKEFVTMLYNTILGRTPDSAGLSSWVSQLDNGCTRYGIFAGFIGSTEFTNLCKSCGITRGSYTSPYIVDQNPQVTAFVARLYTKALGRSYDSDGLTYWVTKLLNKSIGGGQVSKGFFLSQEFINKNYSDKTFVTICYRVYLNREPDSAGLADWVNRLAKGASREDILDGFIGSTEYSNLCASYGINR